MEERSPGKHPEVPTPPTSLSSHSSQRIELLDLFGTETIENLSNGFLAVLEPELDRVNTSLEELVYVHMSSLHGPCWGLLL